MTAVQEFEELLAPVLNSAYGTALHLSRQREDAENLVQESSLRAFRAFHTFQTGTNFRAWFLRIVTNLFWEECRRRKRRPDTVSVDEAPDLYLYIESSKAGLHKDCEDPARSLMSKLSQEQVSRALQSLSEEFRVVATLYFADDLSYAEIGEILELPGGTVRSRLHRARKLLQRALWAIAQELGIAVTPVVHRPVSRERHHSEQPAPPPSTGPPSSPA